MEADNKKDASNEASIMAMALQKGKRIRESRGYPVPGHLVLEALIESQVCQRSLLQNSDSCSEASKQINKMRE